MKTLVTFGGAMLLASTSAAAQTASPEAGKPAATAQSPVAANDTSANVAPENHTGAFTDAQIESYAKAQVEVQQLRADPALDTATKQARAAEIVAASGLDTATFNAITQATRSDAAVAERVQLAIANHRGSPEG